MDQSKMFKIKFQWTDERNGAIITIYCHFWLEVALPALIILRVVNAEANSDIKDSCEW